MLERMLAALAGTQWMGTAWVSALPARCPRAASVGGHNGAGGKAGSHCLRDSLTPDHTVGVCVPSHDVWSLGHTSLAAKEHQVPGT